MSCQIVRPDSAALVDEGWDGLEERERLAGEAVHELAKSISFDNPDDAAREIGQALAHEMLSGSASSETGVDILDALRLALYIPHDSHLDHLDSAPSVRVDEPPEDWLNPLMVASSESTPGRAAENLGWPLVVCEAIHVQFLASALDPYEVRYLKAVRAGQERLKRFKIGQLPDGPRELTRLALEELARPFEDKLEGGDE